MRIAVPLQESSHDGKIALRFARAQYFALIDKDQHTIEFFQNPCSDMSLKTGKCIMDFLVDNKKIDTLLAFELGLRVQQIAKKNDLQMILINEQKRTLKELLELMNF
jgi:predicted Fe-Mo cluster-binding NifX family protein